MQTPRAARAVDQVIGKHLQDWDHDGSRFTWQEDGQDFTLLTWFTPNSQAQVTAGAPKDVPHIAIQTVTPEGETIGPFAYAGTFGCTTERTTEMALWVKDFVEMTLSLAGLEVLA